jgi:hypothetical protein
LCYDVDMSAGGGIIAKERMGEKWEKELNTTLS